MVTNAHSMLKSLDPNPWCDELYVPLMSSTKSETQVSCSANARLTGGFVLCALRVESEEQSAKAK